MKKFFLIFLVFTVLTGYSQTDSPRARKAIIVGSGREIELQAGEDYIQWRYVGEDSWTNLVDISELEGKQGKEIELRENDGYVEWRYTDGSWARLFMIPIGEACFVECTSLTLATVLPTIPPTLGEFAFDGVHTSFNIKVRSPYVDAYKTATNWNQYSSKISAI